MKRRERVRQKRLEEIESEFQLLLVSCLRECAKGRWGLFGQNDHLQDSRFLSWAEASRLKELAEEIKAIQDDIGGRNEVCDRFLKLCLGRGPNLAGDPKLAAAFLKEIAEA